MQWSQGEDYAVRALVDLALNPSGRVPEIAARMSVPRPRLAKVIQSLARAGLVETTRGGGGGVRLARPAEEIDLHQVVQAMAGPLRFLRCARRNRECPRDPDCAIYRLWFFLQAQFSAELRRIRIADLLHTCQPPIQVGTERPVTDTTKDGPDGHP
jgi:Rrf2 family nitric oxide-sensitive transcriptional repressor